MDVTKYSEKGGFFFTQALAGFKGGMCSLFQNVDFSMLVVNMHVSSKDLGDRREQSIDIIKNCIKEMNKELGKSLEIGSQKSSEK